MTLSLTVWKTPSKTSKDYKAVSLQQGVEIVQLNALVEEIYARNRQYLKEVRISELQITELKQEVDSLKADVLTMAYLEGLCAKLVDYTKILQEILHAHDIMHPEFVYK